MNILEPYPQLVLWRQAGHYQQAGKALHKIKGILLASNFSTPILRNVTGFKTKDSNY